MAKEINWQGKSGTNYTYKIYPLDTSFKAIAGNYCFAKEVQPNKWRPIYFGETGDLSTRFDNHHKMDCVTKNGADSIHVHANNSSNARLDEEADLIAKWDPVCNG